MWQTPKTNWYGKVDTDGVYSGDRFNAEDFNRIKNNLEYLKELSLSFHDDYSINALGNDRTPTDYFYADEINDLEENLNTINSHTVNMEYGNSPNYMDNSSTMDFNELNRLEKATLDIYNRLNNEYEGRRMFVWNFGMKGGTL